MLLRRIRRSLRSHCRRNSARLPRQQLDDRIMDRPGRPQQGRCLTLATPRASARLPRRGPHAQAPVRRGHASAHSARNPRPEELTPETIACANRVVQIIDSDQEALTALVQAANDSPSQFGHVAARLRAIRAEPEAKTAFAAELQAQGIAIYGDRPYVPWTLALENLRDGDGNEITAEAHATCPGRAVTITYDWHWAPGAQAAYRATHGLAGDDDLADVEFGSDEQAREAGFVPGWQIGRHLCTDPAQYGHTNVHGTPSGTPTQQQQTAEDEAAEAARKTEERRRVRRRNTEWRAATETRTSHLTALLGRKAPPAGALTLIVEAMARGRDAT